MGEPHFTRKGFISQIRHLAWVCYQMGAGQPYNTTPTDAQIQSLYDGIDYMDKNPDLTSAENHENWKKYKEGLGWIYGPVKCEEKKTHPDLVPFMQLPMVEQRKDTMAALAHNKGHYLYVAMGMKEPKRTRGDRDE